MIEESARVISVDGEHIWVETQRKSVCGSCSAQKGCGTASLEKVLGKRRTQVMVLSQIAVSPGDEVMIGIQESALLRGSFALYGIPLLLMLLGAVIAEALVLSQTELPVVMGALFGLLGGLLYVALFSRKTQLDPRYQPVILRIISPTNHRIDSIFAP